MELKQNLLLKKLKIKWKIKSNMPPKKQSLCFFFTNYLFDFSDNKSDKRYKLKLLNLLLLNLQAHV